LAKEKDEKYKLSIVEYSPISVRVAAVDDILSELKELNIEVKSEINSIEMRSSTFTKEINIEDYLPEGVYCADKTNKINITMEYKPFITKTLEFTNSDILIEGLKSNYELVFKSPDKFSIDVIGLEEELQDITNVNITPYIDVSDLNIGSYALKLLYKAPENLRIKSDINVEFEIIEKIEE
jgi:YbbR domain-containing protein